MGLGFAKALLVLPGRDREQGGSVPSSRGGNDAAVVVANRLRSSPARMVVLWIVSTAWSLS